MRTALRFRGLAVLLVALMTSSAWADNYSDTVDVFKNAIPSAFFENSYGYALFPTIGKGGAGIGGAHGKGQVYAKGGLMYEAAIGGQKFNYKNVKSPD